MNSNSYICKFISENKENWEDLLCNDYDLRIKKEGSLAIFNYSILGDFYNPIVQEARGIIIDVQSLEVVCWPFRKFGNYTEGYADKIDWQSAKVLEKVDGSIIKLWYDFSTNVWRFSTNNTIDAKNASIEDFPGLTYGMIIKKAENYNDIPFDKLDKLSTYIFELVSPETRVIIDYGKTMLYHLGTRHNLTGQEREEDIGIIKPEKYSVSTLQECVKLASTLNDKSSGVIEKEGFVVVDKNFNRVKIKSLEYISRHHVELSVSLNKQDCLDMLINNPQNAYLMYGKNNKFKHVVKFYDYKLHELIFEAEKIAVLAKNLYEEYSFDRKAVAKVLVDYPLSFIGFKCLDTGLSGEEIIRSMPIQKLAVLIPDYEYSNNKK